MLKNYLKIAFRNLMRNRGFSAINIIGLATGMASTVIILLWLYNEVSFDRYHSNKDYLYTVWNRSEFDGRLECWDNTPKILGPTLLEEYPEVVNMARQNSRWYVTRVGEKKASIQGLVTDPAFLFMFDFPLLQGDRNTVLRDVFSMVVTRKMALKMFGTENVLNKVVTIDNDNFIITGVLQDLPPNTAFQFDYILPWAYQERTLEVDSNWGNNSVRTFIQLKPGIDVSEFEAKIRDVTITHSNGEEDSELFLHPISKWHLYSRFENGKIAGGRIENVRMFGIVAVFILLIACINFMNLSTARSEKRAREVGVRKTAGANRMGLAGQFIGESILIVFIAGIVAILLVLVSLPAFNLQVGKALSLPYQSIGFWLIALLFIVLTGIVAGSYPAFFLSSFDPVSVLKGTFKRTEALINPRKILVVVQFCFAVVLMISTLMVVKQIRHAQNRDTGYNREQVVYHWITGDIEKNYPLIKNELLTSGVASSVTKTASPLTFGMSDTWGVEWKGKNRSHKIDFDRYSEDEGLVKTAGLQLISGRDMDLAKYPSDSTAMLLNESAVKVMGFKDPIGQTVRDGDREYHVIGVVKDFLLGSPFAPLKPMIIEGAKSYFNVIHIRFTGRYTTAESLAKTRTLFNRFNPDYPFEYHFVDEDYALKFIDTQRIAVLTGLFAGLTIFISCLGLFGLAAYMAENRVKEIGVRKVLGASIVTITVLLSREFLLLVSIGIAIAIPIAWFAMESWLQHYSYRIAMQWGVVAWSGIGAVGIALVTVSYQAIKAALTNPVKSLRSE